MTNSVGVVREATSPETPKNVFRNLLNCLIFASALMLSCVEISRHLPFPEVFMVSDELEHLRRHGNDYDVLFIGSSRVRYQILPELFDLTMAKHGFAVRSFNAGIAGMVPPEDGYFVDQILRQPHSRLRWVFVEIMPVREAGARMLAGTRRFTYWRDWERTLLVEKSLHREFASVAERSALPWWDRARVCADVLGRWMKNLALFAEHSSNLGRGEDLRRLLNDSAKLAESRARPHDGVDNGWQFPEQEERMTGKKLAAYESEYAMLQKTGARFETGDPVSEEAIHRITEKFLKIGVRPILIIPPTTAQMRFLPVQNTEPPQVIFDLSDPKKHPDLFLPEHRADGIHLNVAGAEIFTRALALRFAELHAAQQP